MGWKPGAHKQRIALETPYEGVPSHLAGPLWEWVEAQLRDHLDPAVIAVSLRVKMQPGLAAWQQIGIIRGWAEGSESNLLDLVEKVLEVSSDWDAKSYLDGILELANSAYRVRGDEKALELRLIAGQQEVVGEAIASSINSAGDHLTAAWNAAYGIHHDAVKAYAEAIKAVESALAPHVSPQNPKQTLGTMIRDMAMKPTKWKFIIDDGNVSSVETLVYMMRVIWDGQTSRHGSALPTRAETIEESRAVVHLAACLVQLGSSGAFAAA